MRGKYKFGGDLFKRHQIFCYYYLRGGVFRGGDRDSEEGGIGVVEIPLERCRSCEVTKFKG
jgi:hypothetical protein